MTAGASRPLAVAVASARATIRVPQEGIRLRLPHESSGCLCHRSPLGMMAWRPSRRMMPTTRATLHHNNGYRFLTSQAARALLGLPTTSSKAPVEPASSTPLTLKELRHAYFAAAKKCHPDLKNSNDDDKDDNDDDDKDDDADEFLQVTLAYEMLQGEIMSQDQDLLLVSTITVSEDEEFRKACWMQLGIDPEIVEECKKSPVFRQWLLGRTDSAHLWRGFFTQHGGLAPKLRPWGGLLVAGDNPIQPPSHTTRRKKK